MPKGPRSAPMLPPNRPSSGLPRALPLPAPPHECEGGPAPPQRTVGDCSRPDGKREPPRYGPPTQQQGDDERKGEENGGDVEGEPPPPDTPTEECICADRPGDDDGGGNKDSPRHDSPSY